MITYTEPGLQGDRSTGGTKPATLETGAEIQVPLFIEHRREGQGRHPRRVLPRPHQLADRRTRTPRLSRRSRDRAQQGPQAGARRPVRGRAARGRRPRGAARPQAAARRAGQPVHDRPSSRASSSTGDRIDELLGTTPSAGRSTACRPSTARAAPRGVRAAVVRRRPRRRRVDEAVDLARSLSTDDSPVSSTACSAGCSRSGPPSPDHPARRATDGSACRGSRRPVSHCDRADRYPVRSNALVLELAYSIGSTRWLKEIVGSNPTENHRSRGRQRLDEVAADPADQLVTGQQITAVLRWRQSTVIVGCDVRATADHDAPMSGSRSTVRITPWALVHRWRELLPGPDRRTHRR